MQSLRWPLLFGTVLGLLIFSLYASFAFHGVASWTIGLIYISYDSLLLAFMVISSQVAVTREERRRQAPPPPLPPVVGPRPTLTVLICARNERLVLPQCLRALAAQTEPADEIIVLDDGSTDSMVSWLTAEYRIVFDPNEEGGRIGRSQLWPSLCVLRKPNSGKADSLNLGWRIACGEIIVTLDADTYIEPSALSALRDGFVEDPDLGIAGGVLVPVCQRTPWAGFFQFFQTFEYARGFLWRYTWMQYNMLLLISGAFAAYRRSLLEAVGGFDTASWVEDYELTHRIYRDSYDSGQSITVKTLSGARGTTDSPASVATFLNQRRRWFAGFIATHFKYHDMVGNPRYGAMGKYMLCVKTLDLLLPIYALVAAVVLIILLSIHHGLPIFIVEVIVIKLIYDLSLHAYSIRLYQRWLGLPLSTKFLAQSFGATLTEPFVFQIMRQLGAALGWLAFLRRKIDWQPQRPPAAEVVAESQPI